MGFLSRQPAHDPDADGAPLGNRSIRSFIQSPSIVRGGERPEMIDSSRPGSEPDGKLLMWGRKEKAAAVTKPADLEQIQRGYEELFE